MANDTVCDLRKADGMNKATEKAEQEAQRLWLREMFDLHPKKKQIDLAALWGRDSSAVSKVFKGVRTVKIHERQIAEAFFEGAADIPKSDEDLGAGVVLEVDGYGGLGTGGITIEDWEPDGNGGHKLVDAVKARWVIPPDFMRHTLDATPGNVRIIKAIGDSMEPSIGHGDKVLVDTNHIRPSPPGIYAVWDGEGVVIKRVQQVSHGDSSRVELVSDNPKHKTYEVSLEDARIIGRVICKISAM